MVKRYRIILSIMSYQVLARKWRPKSFSEVVGQENVLTILSNALSLGRIHHAYLFSGTRGVGKTSIARLLAKGLNCEAGITATPCGVCDNCQDIDQGRFVDLLEIDAASRTKVEDTREILDNVQYLPTKGRFKVYLIDEVHMLSRSSFNALLKTLEEPPEHVKFLLATTDPQKLPVTILSRCLHLHLNVLDLKVIENQLAKILQVEQIKQEEKAIHLLAKAANGSMRDALSLTDQAIALGNGEVTSSAVIAMLGTLDQTIPFSLIEALYHEDGSALMQQLEMAAKQGADWDTLLVDTITLLHQIAFLQIVPTALGDYIDDQERIRYLAQVISPNDIQLFYQILLDGRKDLSYAPDKKLGVEMSFLRALAFIPKNKNSASTAETVVNTSVSNQQTKQNSTQDASKITSTVMPQITDDKSTSLSTPASEQSTIKNATATVVSDETQSILAARQRLIDGEKNLKKSKQVEFIQPKKQPAQAKANIKTKQTNSQSTILTETNSEPVDSFTNKKELNDDGVDSEDTAETYQWQFSDHFTPVIDTNLDAKSVRSTFEEEKTPELMEKLIQEAVKIDPWSAEIETLMLPPLIKQIAINTFLQQISEQHLILHVRSRAAHLIKHQTNVKRLNEALSKSRQQSLKIEIVIDDDKTQATPVEVRETIYQEKRQQAILAINKDSKVAMICQFFEAKIDDDSIHPV